MFFDINQKHQKRLTGLIHYLMDKIIQNRLRKEGWEGIEEGWRVFSSFSQLPVFYFIAGWNHSKLIFLIFKKMKAIYIYMYIYIVPIYLYYLYFNTVWKTGLYIPVSQCVDMGSSVFSLYVYARIYLYVHVYVCLSECVCLCVCVLCVCFLMSINM